ncbi:hypothetical protein CPB84DRAFT_1781112 [Gymnopilus junonius]|uniref:Uncharacterized protein n=1 Tax=Gymnopilus junonius TaxID=109634 RepID=A0A9P5NJ76_GYMJU|nr:hypothetical protein CPB84DRAFT_1781112 [Gymnopilus junonius]
MSAIMAKIDNKAAVGEGQARAPGPDVRQSINARCIASTVFHFLRLEEQHRKTCYKIAFVSHGLQAALELLWGVFLAKHNYDLGKHQEWITSNVYFMAGAFSLCMITMYGVLSWYFEKHSLDASNIRARQIKDQKHYTANYACLCLTSTSLLPLFDGSLEPISNHNNAQAAIINHTTNELPPPIILYTLISLISIAALSNAIAAFITYCVHKRDPVWVHKYHIPSWIIWQRALERFWRGEGFSMY